MRDYTFYLDGKCALDYGIRLEQPVEFSETAPIYDAQTIPGRNGDLIFDTGSYENRSGNAECFILQNDAIDAVGSANKFLLAKKGYRRLQTSEDPAHFWLAVVENGLSIEDRKNVLMPFEVGFDCKPQRFLVNGETPVVFTQSGVINNQYGFPALPIIKVYGTGAGVVKVGEYEVEIKQNSGLIILDSDMQSAYDGFANRNNYIKADQFPVLVDGENHVTFSGAIKRLEIIPRWWEL